MGVSRELSYNAPCAPMRGVAVIEQNLNGPREIDFSVHALGIKIRLVVNLAFNSRRMRAA